MKHDTSHLPAGAAPVADPAVATVTVAAERACRRIAPLFPLQTFVAVNPFMGIAERPLDDGAALMGRVAGARLTMPRAFYREALASGRLTVEDIREALAATRTGEPAAADAEAIATALKASGADAAPPSPLPTVAGVAAATTGRDWESFATERLSAFAADAFDAGQASWPAPWRARGLLAAWRAVARVDLTPEIAGVTGFRSVVASLPDRAEDLLAAAASRLGLSDGALADYFHRLLMTVGGWAGHARWRLWQAELAGGSDRTLVELLAARATFEVALREAFRASPGFESAWQTARAGFEPPADARRATGTASDLATDAVLQLALERAWQRELFRQLAAAPAAPPATPARPAVQAVFCIDVRSEVFRRALESTTPEVETGGFAGFFGVPAAVVPFGEKTASARCPVLLRPSLLVCEEPAGTAGPDGPRQRQQRLARLAGAKIWRTSWQAFRTAAVSAFTFVETTGLTYAGRLLARTLPAAKSPGRAASGKAAARLKTAFALQTDEAAPLAVAARIDLAEGVLRAMSMTEGFARLVLLAGHGATTANNPYAHGLDCGACGGQSGEVSARVAAALFNEPAVRQGLRARGIAIPDDTLFVAGLHDTTTDTVTLYDADTAGTAHRADLARLSGWLAVAGRRARAERAALLGIAPGRAVDAAVTARSTDWSQVRPEWGLARCAAFVAAPRERTLGRDLDGRVFLHSYDWRDDRDFATLKLILTAPVIVASWINLQYYASSVDNRVFGSGNKVLHNVVGTLGVVEGTGGDLRTGLPWQSVHDGGGLVHEPLRLSVLVEAPVEAINTVIEGHDGLRQLVDNGWVHLLALGANGAVAHRYTGGLQWQDVPPAAPAPATTLGVAA